MHAYNVQLKKYAYMKYNGILLLHFFIYKALVVLISSARIQLNYFVILLTSLNKSNINLKFILQSCINVSLPTPGKVIRLKYTFRRLYKAKP